MSTIKKILSLVIALILTVGVGTGALAYSTPDFADVPAGNWAYEPVMKMADAGVIAGTGNGLFSPDMKLSAAMWLTLVGRAVYDEDVTATTTTEDNWFTAYVREAETKGLLTGTAIDKNAIEGELTRYDMAVTLHKAATLLGVKDAKADPSQIPDYGDIPNKYTAAVGQVYAHGLIEGDGAGNFNGSATMRRDEAATVMDKLLALKAKQVEDAKKPVEPETPRTGEMVTFTVVGDVYIWDTTAREKIPMPNIGLKFCYKDGRVLAEGVSGADGKFELTVTADKADYNEHSSVYYIDARGTDANGKEYWNERHARNSLYDTQPWLLWIASGWDVQVYDW